MLFGLPFLLAGRFVLCSPLLPEGTQPEDKKSGKPMPIGFAIPFGGVFALVGAALAFGRAGKVLDKRAGTVTTWWGMLVPFSRKQYPLSKYDTVMLRREVRRSKNSSYTVYPVRIEGAGAKTVKIEEPRDERKAREAGEEVAKFLGVKLVDRTMGTEVVREAEQLDESIRERVVRTGERPEVQEPPPGRKTRESVVGDTLRLDIPGRGMQPACYFAVIPGLIVPVFIYFTFFSGILADEKMPTGAKIGFMLFVGICFILLPLVVGVTIFIGNFDRGTTVEVSPRELTVRRRFLVGTRVRTIGSDELEELVLIGLSTSRRSSLSSRMERGARRVAARSDRTTAEFGQGLADAELEWLRAIVWNVVSA